MIRESDCIEVDCIEVSQRIGTFYICSMSWQELSSIAYADIRRLENDDLGSYMGIQRRISKKRVKEISEYVKTCDATFPTSIIIAIDRYNRKVDNIGADSTIYDSLDESIEQDPNIEFIKSGSSLKLKIKRAEGVALILDGQHRLVGLRSAWNQMNIEDEGHDKDFQLNVTIFVDIDMDDKAQIFSIINKSQTKVNKSLVYDLYEYSKTDCPQKSVHDIVRLLDQNTSSPFYKKIKILGPSEDFLESISQATLAELIIGYISVNPIKDRDEIKRHGGKKRSHISRNYDANKLIFRSYFINDQDEYIYLVLERYFTAVKEKWPTAWMDNNKYILSKTTGVVALMRLLRDVYKTIKDPKATCEQYRQVVSKSTLKDSDFTTDNYKPGTMGQAKLYKDLISQCFTSIVDS